MQESRDKSKAERMKICFMVFGFVMSAALLGNDRMEKRAFAQ